MGLLKKLFGGREPREADKTESPRPEEAAGTKDPRPGETNEIENTQLKKQLADAAMGLLKAGRDYDRPEDIRCSFGYLYFIRDHGLEALFRLTTDRGEFYFAAQKQSLLRLDLNEELFRSTVETFLSLHQ